MKRRPLKPEEERLWRHVTQDITTLTTTTALPPLHYHTPPVRSRLKHYSPVSPVLSVSPQATVPQIPDHNWQQKLRRGRVRPEGKLDLHGMTREQAFQKLHRYIDIARTRGKRVVLVVTGKGSGILKREVPMWLSQGELGQQIVSFYSAGQADGGEGALYVVLKKVK